MANTTPRKARFSPAPGALGPTAETSPTAAKGPEPAPSVEPAAGRLVAVPETPAAAPGMSVFSSKLASKNGHRPDSPDGDMIDLHALMTHQVDPELDLVPVGIRIPRYLAEALRRTAEFTRRSKQDIIADSLKTHLPANMVRIAREAAER